PRNDTEALSQMIALSQTFRAHSTPRRDGGIWYCAQISHVGSGKPDDEGGFAALAQLEPRQVALGSPPQSLGEDAQAECQETPRKPRKRLRPTRFFSPLEVGFAPDPADAGGGGAIHKSPVDAADVDRSGQRDVLARANASA